MARETELTCPSGLRIRLRGIKGKDLDGLRDKRRIATGEAISQLLDDCTLDVLDRAVYTKLPTFLWADALVGDRMQAIIKLREATNGPTYDFRLRCGDKECRQMIDWTIELPDLPVRELPPESARLFMEANIFETEVAGTKVKFRLNTGRDQVRLAKLAAQLESKLAQRKAGGSVRSEEGRTLLSLSGRIVQIDGVTDIMSFLGDLDLEDITDLMRSMDTVDCGVETTIEVICSGSEGCGLTQAVELPLDSTFFARN
jgi:hypothetical protein